MTAQTAIPCSISPEAAERTAELGIQREFEQMLEYALQFVPDLRQVEVTLAPPYDAEEEPRIVINASVGYQEGDPLNPGFQIWAEWVGRTLSPDVWRHVTMLLWDEQTAKFPFVKGVAPIGGPGRREDFEKYLAAVPNVAPPENDRLD